MNHHGTFFVGLLVGLVIGGSFGFYYKGRLIHKELVQAGVVQEEAPLTDVITGTILSVSQEKLEISVTPPFDPSQSTRPARVYKVGLTPQTTFALRTLDLQALPGQKKDFSPFRETVSSWSALRVGEQVLIEATVTITSERAEAGRVIILQ